MFYNHFMWSYRNSAIEISETTVLATLTSSPNISYGQIRRLPNNYEYVFKSKRTIVGQKKASLPVNNTSVHRDYSLFVSARVIKYRTMSQIQCYVCQW